MERQKATVRARHEVINSRFKEWECMRDIWRHPTKSHHKVFWAIANITQLRIVHEGIAFWVDYNDNQGNLHSIYLSTRQQLIYIGMIEKGLPVLRTPSTELESCESRFILVIYGDVIQSRQSKRSQTTIYITSPGHETPLASGVSTNVSVDVDTRQHDSEADVDARQHDPGQDQDQPAFNRLWNNQYAVLMELDM
eukprot:scaffold884_cov202-Amphora_coffeaeformis.AAC.4